jgi:hypothetical protein
MQFLDVVPANGQRQQALPKVAGRSHHRLPGVIRRRAAQDGQCGIAQSIGIALAVLGTRDDLLGNYCGGRAGAVNTKGRARHFECDPHDALGFIIESEAFQIPPDRHLKRSVSGGRTMLCRDMATTQGPVENGDSPDPRCSQADKIDITSVLGRNDNVKHLYIEKPQPCASPIASHFHPRAPAHRALRDCEASASHARRYRRFSHAQPCGEPCVQLERGQRTWECNPMNRADEFRDRADQCRRLAESAAKIPDKERWLSLAEHWLLMAQHEDERVKRVEQAHGPGGAEPH